MMIFSELVTGIAFDLQQGGSTKDANELQHFADLALNQSVLADVRKDALKQIEMRCHAKWLGDFYLAHLSQEDWWGKIEKLGKSANKQVQSA